MCIREQLLLTAPCAAVVVRVVVVVGLAP
nr:ilvB operon leader peptide IvbL [Providencia heimbachae]